jgi:hypothetical protein
MGGWGAGFPGRCKSAPVRKTGSLLRCPQGEVRPLKPMMDSKVGPPTRALALLGSRLGHPSPAAHWAFSLLRSIDWC